MKVMSRLNAASVCASHFSTSFMKSGVRAILPMTFSPSKAWAICSRTKYDLARGARSCRPGGCGPLQCRKPSSAMPMSFTAIINCSSSGAMSPAAAIRLNVVTRVLLLTVFGP
jgi:hypothetical protein